MKHLDYFSISKNFDIFWGHFGTSFFLGGGGGWRGGPAGTTVHDFRTWNILRHFGTQLIFPTSKDSENIPRSQALEYFRTRFVRPSNVARFVTKQIELDHYFRNYSCTLLATLVYFVHVYVAA